VVQVLGAVMDTREDRDLDGHKSAVEGSLLELRTALAQADRAAKVARRVSVLGAAPCHHRKKNTKPAMEHASENSPKFRASIAMAIPSEDGVAPGACTRVMPDHASRTFSSERAMQIAEVAQRWRVVTGRRAQVSRVSNRRRATTWARRKAAIASVNVAANAADRLAEEALLTSSGDWGMTSGGRNAVTPAIVSAHAAVSSPPPPRTAAVQKNRFGRFMCNVRA
jgi:hypothetical protein